MTDEEFDKTVEGIDHLLRLGHILESRLGGRVDEDALKEIAASRHAEHEGRLTDAETRVTKLEGAVRDRDVAIETLEAENLALKEELKHCNERIEATKALFDGGDGDEPAADVPMPVAGDDEVHVTDTAEADVKPAADDADTSTKNDEASRAIPAEGIPVTVSDDGALVEAGGVTYDVLPLSDATTKPGTARPILVSDLGLAFPSIVTAVAALSEDGLTYGQRKGRASRVTHALHGDGRAIGHTWRRLAVRD